MITQKKIPKQPGFHFYNVAQFSGSCHLKFSPWHSRCVESGEKLRPVWIGIRGDAEKNIPVFCVSKMRENSQMPKKTWRVLLLLTLFGVVLWIMMFDVQKKLTAGTKTHGKVKISSEALLHPWQNWGGVFHGFSVQVWVFTTFQFAQRHWSAGRASVFDMQALPAQALLATLGANKKRLEALNFWTQHWSKCIAEIFWNSLISWFLPKKKSQGFIEGICSPRSPSHHLLPTRMRVSEHPQCFLLSQGLLGGGCCWWILSEELTY